MAGYLENDKTNNEINDIADLYLNKMYSEAAESSEEFLKKSNEVIVYRYLADSLYNLEKADEAVSAVKECVENNPDNLDALEMAVTGCIKYAEDCDTAQLYLEKMIEISPYDERTALCKVYFYLSKKDFENAFSAVDKSIKMRPSDMSFKHSCAEIIIDFAQSFYKSVIISEDEYMTVDSEKAYNDCLLLSQKAYNICDEEFTRENLESIKGLGEIVHNEESGSYIKRMRTAAVFYALISAIMFILSRNKLGTTGIVIGIILCVIAFILLMCSFKMKKLSNRPLWWILSSKINRMKDPEETICILLYSVFTGIFKLIFGIIKSIFRMFS